MATKKEYEAYLKSTLGHVKKDDKAYLDGSLRNAVSGQSTAERGLVFIIILGIVEVIVPVILSQTTNIDSEVLLFFAFYSLVKNIIIGCIFSHINTQNSSSSHDWTSDRIKLAVTKICLAKTGFLKSDTDLDDLDLRNP